MPSFVDIARSPLSYAAGTITSGAITASLYLNTGTKSLERAVDCNTPELERLQQLGSQVCKSASSEFLLDSSATLAGLAATTALVVATAFTGYRSLRQQVLKNDQTRQTSLKPVDQIPL